jgi:hypothetical protein
MIEAAISHLLARTLELNDRIIGTSSLSGMME